MAEESRRPWPGSLLFWSMLAVVALSFYLVVAFGNKEAEGPVGARHPAVGRKLPHLSLQPLVNVSEAVTLADLSGEVALINFWGTWCAPCWQEFPHIVNLWKKYEARDDFRLLAVSCEGDGDEQIETLRQETAAFLQRFGAEMPVYADLGAGSRNAVASTRGSFGYPTTIVLDRQGVIRGMWEGFRPGVEQQMDALVEELLAEPANLPE